jgi:DNA end-binding protein Ku
VKPMGDALVLELMHFPDEVLKPAGLDLPGEEKLGKKEMEMARSLVETMSGKWKPSEFHDDYRDKLIKLIEQKVARGGKEVRGPKVKPRKATNVVDLVAVLQKSLRETKKKPVHTRAKKLKRAA